MPDTSVLDVKDKYGKTARDYARIQCQFSQEITDFCADRLRVLTDYELIQGGDVKSYADTVSVSTSVFKSMFTHLVAEGFVTLTDKGQLTEEEATAEYEKYEKAAEARLAPLQPQLSPFDTTGGYA